MSFSFNFQDVELDDELDAELASSTASLHLDATTPELSEAPTSVIPHAEVPLSDLMATLPPLISYTPVVVSLSRTGSSSQETTTILRRDLFDARFQVLQQDDDDHDDEQPQEDEDGLEVVVTEAVKESEKGKGKGKVVMVDEGSDLVKGVYEGGFKTWECSLDLVDCLEGMGFAEEGEEDQVRGKSLLEIGCGTALPSCYLFARLIREIERAPPEDRKPTRLHLQDYNQQVLSHITLPNLLLTFIRHQASSHFTPSQTTGTIPPGDVEITSAFLLSFESFLTENLIDLRFFVGDWSGFSIPSEHRYDLVLTSETIYSIPSLPSLLALLRAASWPEGRTKCLVACKRIYFGVGGGEHELRGRVEEMGGQVETAWGDGEGDGRTKGVGRVVMSVKW